MDFRGQDEKLDYIYQSLVAPDGFSACYKRSGYNAVLERQSINFGVGWQTKT